MGRDRRPKDVAEFLSAFRADLGHITLEVEGLEELAVRYGLPRRKEDRVAAAAATAEPAVAVAEPAEPASAPAQGSEPPTPERRVPGPKTPAVETREREAPREAIRPTPQSLQPQPSVAPPPAPAPMPSQDPGARPARPESHPGAPPARDTPPPRRARLRSWAWAAVAGTVVAAGAWRAYGVWEASVESRAHRVFPLPFSHSALLAGDGRRLFTVDPVRSLLFTIDLPALKIGQIRRFPGGPPAGLAWGSVSLWSADPAAGRIVEHEADAGLAVRRAFANPESRPAALSWDGRHLWTSDARTETISQYAVGDALKVVRQYTLPGVDPIGLHVGGELLWVMDRATQRVLRYRPKSLLEAHDTLDFAAWLPPRSQVTGFTVQEGVVWLVTENPSEVHGFDLALLDGLRARRRARSLFGGRR